MLGKSFVVKHQEIAGISKCDQVSRQNQWNKTLLSFADLNGASSLNNSVFRQIKETPNLVCFVSYFLFEQKWYNPDWIWESYWAIRYLMDVESFWHPQIRIFAEQGLKNKTQCINCQYLTKFSVFFLDNFRYFFECNPIFWRTKTEPWR